MKKTKRVTGPLSAAAVVLAVGVALLAGAVASAATVVTPGSGQVTTAAGGTPLQQPIVLSLNANEMDAIGETIILTAPAGFEFISGTASVGGTPATTLGVGAGVVGGGGTTLTYSATAANNVAGAQLTLTPTMRAIAGGSAGQIAMSGSGVAANANVGTVQASYVSPYSIAMSTTPPVSSLPADGSQQVTVNATVTDANGTPVANRSVNWTSSVGYLSTGTSKSATSFTGTNGVATQSYRGAGGVQTTDTIIASIPSGNAVGTLSMPLTSPSGNTASKITILAPSNFAIAPNITNVSPGYASPTIGSNVAVRTEDASGLGVNNQVMLVSVDKGAIVANPAFAGNPNTICNGVTANSITATSAGTELASPGGQAGAGYINFAVCADQNDPAGQITITAQNISTSMPNATQTISHAGRPSKIEATVNGNQINVRVTDAGGNNVADGTPVRFTMSQNAGAVSTGCTTTSNGQASSVAALVQQQGTVIVTADYNESGTAATCAAAGTKQIATSASISQTGGGGTGGTGTGAGTFASAPVFSASGLAQVVYNGGSVAQLDTALRAVGANGAWGQAANGQFHLYIVNGGFVNDAFRAAFPNGFAGVTAMTLVKLP